LTDFLEADDSKISPCHRRLLWKWKGNKNGHQRCEARCPGFHPVAKAKSVAIKRPHQSSATTGELRQTTWKW